jgi:hypothetical protein
MEAFVRLVLQRTVFSLLNHESRLNLFVAKLQNRGINASWPFGNIQRQFICSYTSI